MEHVLPQSWRVHWGGDIAGDVAAELQRERAVHLLGNLTLVSGKLNPALSNRPWSDAEALAQSAGAHGKRTWLLEHSNLKLNAALVQHEASWTEADIAERTSVLSEAVNRIWPRPASSVAPTGPMQAEDEEPLSENAVVEYSPGDAADDGLPAHTGKYRALWRWLTDQNLDEITLTFDEVEGILGVALPPSARSHLPHWYGYDGTALGRAIRDAGWKASGVNLTAERVTFVKNTGEV